MNWWEDLFKSPARRKAEQDRARRKALTHARTAVRRERRAIGRRQMQSDRLRIEAVKHEREGKNTLAKQSVRRFVQIDRETTARTMALCNMEHTLEQVQVKDNYDDFVRGMQIVANIEELAQRSVDPDEVRERLADLAQRNQDLVEPWLDTGIEGDPANLPEIELNGEESEAYALVTADAVGAIAGADGALAAMDQELERKMDHALGRE